jgi:predicted nucleotide-binding protein (sugar kinase/HSP70/actin superfamily)
MACRLGQFPVYIDKIRRKLGLDIGVISQVDQGLAAFGLSERNRQRVYLRGWESLNAYDALLRVFLQIRPYAKDTVLVHRMYIECRDKLFHALCDGSVRQGVEEVLHDLHNVAVKEVGPKPVVSVTGDYYTRVVPYANNDVFREIEALGGIVWSPPTFSDSFKMATLRDLTWNLMNRQTREAAAKGFLYVLLAVSEFKVKGASSLRKAVKEPLDLLGYTMWRRASQCADTRLPAGITAPIATALNYLDLGAHGVLNLMTLNCSYGTVVTAALARALKQRPGIPMLSLVYDGLKKTNEKTRLQAFMEQVTDCFRMHLVNKRAKQRPWPF